MFLQRVRHRHLREPGAEVALHRQGAAAAEDRPEGRNDAGESLGKKKKSRKVLSLSTVKHELLLDRTRHTHADERSLSLYLSVDAMTISEFPGSKIFVK